MAITTEDLIEVYNQVLPEAIQEGSALVKAGTRSIAYNTTDITQVKIGAPSNVEEGGIKPIKNPAIDRQKVQEYKLAGILPISDEANGTPEGQELMNRTVAKFVSNFVPAIDISVLAGTNPADGTNIARYDLFNLKDRATVYNSANEDAVDGPFKAARYAVKGRNKSILLSDNGLSQLSALDSVQSGYQKYPTLDSADPRFRGLRVASAHSVGLDGFTEDADIENDVLGYVGDFANIYLAFQGITVKASDTASAGGINAFETNFTLYRIEQRFKAYIFEPENFAVVKDTSV